MLPGPAVGDQTGRDLERGEQGGAAVAFVVVGLLLRSAWPQPDSANGSEATHTPRAHYQAL